MDGAGRLALEWDAYFSRLDNQVQSVVNGSVESFEGRTGVVVSANGDYTASEITNVPAGDIAATNVQTALNELDSEKYNAGDSPSFVNETLTGYLDLTEIAAPSNPATNVARIYAVDDGAGITTATMKDSAGNLAPLSHFLQAGTGAVSRSQHTKLRHFIHVADFGAVGDGTTDDTTAIQNAINSAASRGGDVYFDAKRYRVTANPGIVVAVSGIRLLGVPGGYVFGGALNKGTEILYAGAAGGVIMYVAPSSGTMASVTVSGFTLIANSLADICLYVGTVHDYFIDRIDCECRDSVNSIAAYFTDNIAAGSVFNYRGTINKLNANCPGDATGIFLDGPNPDTGGRHPAFLSFYDCHVTHEDGSGFFLRCCDDCHFFNCATSLIGGGVGNAIYFYSSNSVEIRAAVGNSFYGFQSGANIFVDPGSGTPYQARGNKVFLTAIDHQITITDTARLLWVEDWGSYDATIIPYSIGPRAITHREDAVTNAVSEVHRWRHHSTGTPAAGLGIRHAFEVETAAGNYEDGAYIEVVATDVTSTSEDFDILFKTMRAGAAPSERFAVGEPNGFAARATSPNASVLQLLTSVAAGSGGGAGLQAHTTQVPAAAGDRMGLYTFGVFDTAVRNGGAVVGFSDAAWTSGTSHPTRIALETCPSGSTTRLERLRVGSTGLVTALAPTGGLGYGTGAGGAVTQATNKTTGVTLNTVCGQITMNNAALAAGASVIFTVTNSNVAATDTVRANHSSTGGTVSAYDVRVLTASAGSFTVRVTNITGGSLSEAAVINFSVGKAVAS